MVLNLYWKDIEGNSYRLGKLYKKDKYYFDIDREELKKATHKGCFGIGEINILEDHHESNTLFKFFENRIPINVEEIMKIFNIKEYDEMLILKITGGKLNTDRYYLEEN